MLETATEKSIVEIQTDQGAISLSPSTVRKYLVQGNGAITDQEIAYFLALCKFQRLNPWNRDVYLVKYGNNPASMVVGKDAFVKRAMKNPDCKGFRAGVICQCNETKEVIRTEGFCPPDCKLLGGWAEVHKDHWVFPLKVEVSLHEYIGRKNDGMPNKMWSEKPATMIRKVALVQALRESFPDSFSGLYSVEEIDTVEPSTLPTIPTDAIDVESQPRDPASSSVSPLPTNEPQQTQPTEQRRRRNKFRVDPLIFGSDEILTCGCTVEQLTALHALAKRSSEIRKWISGRVKEVTGYDQWSFMREDEAKSVFDEARGRYPEPSTEAGSNDNGEAAFPDSEKEPTEPAMPEDLVDCPVREGDRMSVSGFCLTNCDERKSMGWCPAVPGDEPPAAEAEGMGL